MEFLYTMVSSGNFRRNKRHWPRRHTRCHVCESEDCECEWGRTFVSMRAEGVRSRSHDLTRTASCRILPDQATIDEPQCRSGNECIGPRLAEQQRGIGESSRKIELWFRPPSTKCSVHWDSNLGPPRWTWRMDIKVSVTSSLVWSSFAI